MVLGSWTVPNYISDKMIHKLILSNSIISKSEDKRNTEEFFAKTLSEDFLVNFIETTLNSSFENFSVEKYSYCNEDIISRLRKKKPSAKRINKKTIIDDLCGKKRKVKKDLSDYKLCELSFYELEKLSSILEKDINEMDVPNISKDKIDKMSLSALMSYEYFESAKRTKEERKYEVDLEIKKRISDAINIR